MGKCETATREEAKLTDELLAVRTRLNLDGHPTMPKVPRERESVWPLQEDFLLLKASLLQGEACASAWQEWKRSGDPRKLPVRSWQLLPLLYHNLMHHGIKDASMPELRLHYLTSLARNKGLRRGLENLLPYFRQAEIDVLLLKGVPLGQLYYRDLGARRMTDLDILVPTSEFWAALGLLHACGFVSCYPKNEEFFDPQFAFALDMHNPTTDVWVDLHCHAWDQPYAYGADDQLWSAATPLRIGQVQCKTLSATDHLIHAFVHGLSRHEVPPLRWVADAVTLLRTCQASLDWSRLVSLCREYGLAVSVLPGLRYVRENFGAPVPLAILGRLEELPIPLGARVLTQVSEAAYPMSIRALVAGHWGTYAAVMGRAGPIQWVCTLPRFVEFTLKVRRPFTRPYWIPGFLARMFRRIRKWWRREGLAPAGKARPVDANL